MIAWVKSVKTIKSPFDGVDDATTEVSGITIDGVKVPGILTFDDGPSDADIQIKVESFLASKGYNVADPIQPTLIGAIKLRSYQLRTQVNTYISAKYDAGQQATINALWNEGNSKGLVNRKAKCQAVLDWVNSVLAVFYQRLGTVAASLDIPSALAVTMDLAPFDATVPPDSIKGIIDTVD